MNGYHTDTIVFETKTVTSRLWLNAQNQSRLFKCSFSAADTLEVSNENNTVFLAYNHEIKTIPGDTSYARCEHEILRELEGMSEDTCKKLWPRRFIDFVRD